eukprot:1148840-Pelagomonas_calceolata.AAC.3
MICKPPTCFKAFYIRRNEEYINNMLSVVHSVRKEVSQGRSASHSMFELTHIKPLVWTHKVLSRPSFVQATIPLTSDMADLRAPCSQPATWRAAHWKPCAICVGHLCTAYPL